MEVTNILDKILLKHKTRFSLCFIVIAFATIFPRICLIGGLPKTDEGYYAYWAQLTFNSIEKYHSLANEGPIMLYPMLCSWVFAFSANHIVLLRFIDVFIAIIASLLLYKIIVKESDCVIGASLISFVFLFTMNNTIFINCGFKNSIFAAYIPLFLAIRLEQEFDSKFDSFFWLKYGCYIGIAILLRETFIIFMFPLGFLAFNRGLSAFCNFLIGTAFVVAIAILLLIIIRGEFSPLLESYTSIGIHALRTTDKVKLLFIQNGGTFIKESYFALFFSLIIFLIRNNSINKKRLIFWMLLSIAPLLEPALKLGFPYHFAVCLPGIAGFSALSWSKLKNVKIKILLSILALSGFLFSINSNLCLLYNNLSATKSVILALSSGTWPRDRFAYSNYLLAAEAILKVAPLNGTLSISGFMYPLYPLTGMLPPKESLSNLSSAFIILDNKFANELISYAPDIIMTTTRTVWPEGIDMIQNEIINSNLYTQADSISISPEKEYGDFGGIIYIKR